MALIDRKEHVHRVERIDRLHGHVLVVTRADADHQQASHR
jgi:hypothetical protein